MNKIEYKRDGDGYVLLEDYYYKSHVKLTKSVRHKFFTISPGGRVFIRKGYKWDGATLIPDSHFNLRASLVHDVYCQAMELKILCMTYRSKADKVFVKIARESGMKRVFANLHFWGLRIYGILRYGH